MGLIALTTNVPMLLWFHAAFGSQEWLKKEPYPCKMLLGGGVSEVKKFEATCSRAVFHAFSVGGDLASAPIRQGTKLSRTEGML